MTSPIDLGLGRKPNVTQSYAQIVGETLAACP